MPQEPRPATADDLARVEALVAEAYAPWVPLIGAVPGPMRDDYAAAIAAGQVTVLPDGTGGIAAILVLIPQDDALLLDNVAVARAAQGKGLGQRLMRLAEARARAAGFDRVRLYTHEKMAANIALYQRAGYAITARVTERGLNRVYMEKRLG
jgi:ribosomal protein S18 acetylase RimI-like enzyme